MNAVASKPEAPSVLADHGMAVLDGHLLGTTSPQQSPNSDRHESVTDAAASFSPHDAPWSGYHFSLENPSADHFFTAATGAVMPQNAAVQTASFSPQSGWPMNDTSGSCTPTPNFDQVTFPHQPPADPQTQAFNPVQLQHSQQMPAAAFPSTSPHTAKDGWFPISADSMDFRPLPAQKGQAFATSTNILRRDGIRKKNARFEIPAERNLRTIDQLINQSTDETEIKELKQQKRLLRNRQAALDSRQRKKQHTERLEEEKKQYTSVISELEEALAEYKAQEAEWIRAKESWNHTQQQYRQYIDSLAMEKEELVRRHTIETGELRKKCAVLSEQMQRMESTAMSTAPSSAGFSADFSELDHLTMNSWDDFSISNEFSLEHDNRTDVPAGVAAKKEPGRPVTGDDKTVTSSVLLMLLLCGAWVVSHGPNSSSDIQTAVSEEMKTASAAVLDNLYRDSGIHLGPSSDHATRPHDPAMAGVEMAGIQQSSLDTLHHRLINPTEHQLHEQAFSLTPTQYNELTSGVGHYAPVTSAYEGARTVGEVLAAEPPPTEGSSGARGGAAESYTRSVLKGRVSSQVLREFARMVAVTKQNQVNGFKTEPVD